jgi:hypothetical protein
VGRHLLFMSSDSFFVGFYVSVRARREVADSRQKDRDVALKQFQIRFDSLKSLFVRHAITLFERPIQPVILIIATLAGSDQPLPGLRYLQRPITI